MSIYLNGTILQYLNKLQIGQLFNSQYNVSEDSGATEGCLRSLACNALTGIETSVGTLADTRNIPYGNIPVSSNALVGRGCSATRRDTSRGYR